MKNEHGYSWSGFRCTTQLAVFLGCILAPAFGYSCDESGLEDLVRTYFLESFSPGCIEFRQKYAYDENWRETCRRMNFEPHKHLYAGFAERTTVKHVGTMRKDARLFGVFEYEAPDTFEFQSRLWRVGNCVEPDEKFPPNWPLPSSESSEVLSCGEDFWVDMPMRARRGSVELVCDAGEWRMYVPDSKRLKGLTLNDSPVPKTSD